MVVCQPVFIPECRPAAVHLDSVCEFFCNRLLFVRRTSRQELSPEARENHFPVREEVRGMWARHEELCCTRVRCTIIEIEPKSSQG